MYALSVEAQSKDSGSISDHQYPVGTKVQAVYSEDGEWYDATIEALTPNGYYVCYDGWGNKEEVIALTEELLSTAKQHENSGSNIERSAGVSPGIPQYNWNEKVSRTKFS